MKKFNNLSVSFWSGLLAAILVTSLYQATLIGDGREYLLYAKAISAHLSPDMRAEDIKYVASILDKEELDFRSRAQWLALTLGMAPNLMERGSSGLPPEAFIVGISGCIQHS